LSCEWDVFRLTMACKFYVGRLSTDGLALNQLALTRNGWGVGINFKTKMILTCTASDFSYGHTKHYKVLKLLKKSLTKQLLYSPRLMLNAKATA